MLEVELKSNTITRILSRANQFFEFGVDVIVVFEHIHNVNLYHTKSTKKQESTW